MGLFSMGKTSNIPAYFTKQQKPMTVKEVEEYLINQLFKTKKKSLANQKVKHGK